MGETAAGVAIRGWPSAGLMQRLANLQRDAPCEADRPLQPRPPTGTKLRPFAVGLLGSLVVGVAAFALIATRHKVRAASVPPPRLLPAPGRSAAARRFGPADPQKR